MEIAVRMSQNSVTFLARGKCEGGPKDAYEYIAGNTDLTRWDFNMEDN